MRPADFDIHRLIHDLQGTCTTIEDHLPEGMNWEDLIDDDHNTIDNEIFLCSECVDGGVKYQKLQAKRLKKQMTKL